MKLSHHQIQIRAAIEKMGECFNKQPSESQIETYAETLEAFTVEQVIFAFKEVIKSGTDFFPSLGKILSYLQPKQPDPEDSASIIVKEIVDRACEYGSYRLGLAFASLSPAAQRVARDTKCLREICNSDEESLPTIKAQLRKLAKATIDSQRTNDHNQKLVSLGLAKPSLIIENESMRMIQFEDFKPGA